jgi:hypothetical protein
VGKLYCGRSGAVVSCILDVRREKHSLHFVVDGELIPHAIVKIPNNEKMHIGVFHIILFIYLFIFVYYITYLFICLFIYLFVCLFDCLYIIYLFLFICCVVFFF